MEKITLGLVAGRHELPVEQYIFTSIVDPTRVDELEGEAYNVLKPLFASTEVVTHDCPCSYADYTDVLFKANKTSLVIYVTGLSVALVAVLNAARALGINDVVLMHFNTASQEYFEQKVVW